MEALGTLTAIVTLMDLAETVMKTQRDPISGMAAVRHIT